MPVSPELDTQDGIGAGGEFVDFLERVDGSVAGELRDLDRVGGDEDVFDDADVLDYLARLGD